MKRVISNIISSIKNIILSLSKKKKNIADSVKGSGVLKTILIKRMLIFTVSCLLLAVIIGVIWGNMKAIKVDIDKENEKLLQRYNKDRDKIKHGQEMSTENNTPMDRI